MSIEVIISFVLNGVGGIIMWFLKNAYDDLKDQHRDHEQQLRHIRDTYFKKEDFREFKDELFGRLDEMSRAIKDAKYDKQR